MGVKETDNIVITLAVDQRTLVLAATEMLPIDCLTWGDKYFLEWFTWSNKT